MLDVGTAIRKSYFNALSGAVSYGGTVIPVKDGKLNDTDSSLTMWILLTEQQEMRANTKSYWAWIVDLTIEVKNTRQASGSKKVVEDICSQILVILFPTRITMNLAIESPFKLTFARFERAYTDPLMQGEANYMESKNLVFRNRITQ